MNRGSESLQEQVEAQHQASMRPRFMNRGSMEQSEWYAPEHGALQ